MLNTFSVINNIGPWELIVVFFACLIGMSFFMLPTLIAVKKNNNNILPVLIVNLVLGWFFLGWIIALIMALKSTPATSTNNQKYSEPTDKYQGPLIYSSENKNNGWSAPIVILIILLSVAVFMILSDGFSVPYPNNNSPIEFSMNSVFPVGTS